MTSYIIQLNCGFTYHVECLPDSIEHLLDLIGRENIEFCEIE